MNQAAFVLNNQTAYVKNKPIFEASQMPRALAWTAIGGEWRETLETLNQWWFTGFKGAPRQEFKEMLKLRDRLLAFGGDEACFRGIDEDLEKILSRGQFWYGDKAKLAKGRDSQCHANSCDLWSANRNNPAFSIHIATGYALSGDGMWRQHSWLVWQKAKSNQIVETTERRVGYFGFVMTEAEAEKFEYENAY